LPATPVPSLAGAQARGQGARLVAAGLISPSQLDMAVREQKVRGGRLSTFLVDLGFITAERLSAFIGIEAKARPVDLKKAGVDKAALKLVPLEVARRLLALPIARESGSLTVAMADPAKRESTERKDEIE
jgi:hypothetical protein